MKDEMINTSPSPTSDGTPLIRLNKVAILPQGRRLLGASIDGPSDGETTNVYSVEIVGWALGRNSPAVSIDFLHGGISIGTVPLDQDRPDISKAFPNATNAAKSGFRASLCALSLPPEAEVLVNAVLTDQTRVPIATISWTRKRIQPGIPAHFHPLLVSTIGRTGSSWVMRVLAEHPEITAYRPFEFEPRFVSYWATLLKSVAEPSRYSRALAGSLDEKGWWQSGGDGSVTAGGDVLDEPIREQLGRKDVLAAAGFIVERLSGLYSEVAQLQGKSAPKYFAEKQNPCRPEEFVPNLIFELFPGAKEIILVRDFRDIICSVFSFNKKRGFASFGRENADSDEQFVSNYRPFALQMLRHWQKRARFAYLLRYEEIILQPETTLTSMLQYLELDASEDAVRETLKRAAAADPGAQQAHATSKDSASSIGRWRHDLAPDLQDQCAKTFGDILQEFGYTT